MRGHEAVLLKEAIEGLAIKPDGLYIDGTFGRGGHSAAILAKLSDKGRLIAVDKDKEAILYARSTLGQEKRFSIHHLSFSELEKVALKNSVDGILLDLGVSSPQLDDAQRGFSFLQEGPLDMRMNQDSALDAAYFINHADEKELIRVFRDYGEERFALRIAKAIIRERQRKLIESTKVLADIVKEANPKWERHKHPATRVFQAIRIHVNQEIEDLKLALEQAFHLLAPHGRLVVISFHSLEDRIVKQFMRDKEEGEKIPHYLPIPDTNRTKIFKRLSKAIKPSEEELKSNPRARSAVLRIGEKRQ